MTPELRELVCRVATKGPLLVALDFDGVLAPLVDDPARSEPLPASVAAIGRLLEAGVDVAVVSGRHLEGLRQVAPLDERVVLVGSHGAEWDGGVRLGALADPAGLGPVDPHRLDAVIALLERIAAAHPGTRVERKPRSAVLHTRLAQPNVAEQARGQAEQTLSALAGVGVLLGKDVVEAMLTRADKGQAVSTLRALTRADAVLFVGDDVTDESVFQTLGAADLGIKVGPGSTAASARVAAPDDVVDVLELVAALAGA